VRDSEWRGAGRDWEGMGGTRRGWEGMGGTERDWEWTGRGWEGLGVARGWEGLGGDGRVWEGLGRTGAGGTAYPFRRRTLIWLGKELRRPIRVRTQRQDAHSKIIQISSRV
jgi:hypothetical protein